MSCVSLRTFDERAAYICFYGVRESIHACGGSQMFGQADCDLGIEYGISRDERKITDLIFESRLGIRNDSCYSDLAAGACSGGDGDDQGKFNQYL